MFSTRSAALLLAPRAGFGMARTVLAPTAVRAGLFAPSAVALGGANLKVFKDKVNLYGKLIKLIRTVKTVTMAKFLKAQERAHVRDRAMRFARKAFFVPEVSRNFKNTDNMLFVTVTTNRGSCGAMNSRIVNYLQDQANAGMRFKIIAYGKKGCDSISRILPEYVSRGIQFDTDASWTTAALLTDHVMTHEFDFCRILFTRFHNVGSQEFSQFVIPSFARFKEYVQAGSLGDDKDVDVTKGCNNLRFFGALVNMDDQSLRDFWEMQICLSLMHALAENGMSELAARMSAVENQLVNLTKLRNWAQAVFNKTRQEGVTAEMLELANSKAGVESMIAEEEKKKIKSTAADIGMEDFEYEELKDGIRELTFKLRVDLKLLVGPDGNIKDKATFDVKAKQLRELSSDLEILEARERPESVDLDGDTWADYVKEYPEKQRQRKFDSRIQELIAAKKTAKA